MTEFDCLQPFKTNIHTAKFDTKQNNIEAKGNVASFFGANTTFHEGHFSKRVNMSTIPMIIIDRFWKFV